MIFLWKRTLNVGAYEYLRLMQTARALIVNSAVEMSGVLIVLAAGVLARIFTLKVKEDMKRMLNELYLLRQITITITRQRAAQQLSSSATRPLTAGWAARNTDGSFARETYHTGWPRLERTGGFD